MGFYIENIDYIKKFLIYYLRENTVGLFQIESAGMREASTQIRPNHIEDIIALVALYRPGPMSNIPTITTVNMENKPDYLHPLLKYFKTNIWSNIYQECTQIAQKLSGFTAGQADILRRAMGKKEKS